MRIILCFCDKSFEVSLPNSCGSGSRQPYLAYNIEKRVVEVVGDMWNSNCGYHDLFYYDVRQFGSFDESLFTPTRHAEIVHVPAIGTVVIAGYDESSSSYTKNVKVITRKSDLNKITKSSNSLTRGANHFSFYLFIF